MDHRGLCGVGAQIRADDGSVTEACRHGTHQSGGKIQFAHLVEHKPDSNGVSDHKQEHDGTAQQCPPEFTQIPARDTLADERSGNRLHHRLHDAGKGAETGEDVECGRENDGTDQCSSGNL